MCPPLADLMIVERLYPCDWNSSMADWRASLGWWKEGRWSGVGVRERESRSTEKEIEGVALKMCLVSSPSSQTRQCSP
jgi:hypothetical protein